MTGIEVGVAVIIGVLLGRFLPNRRKGPKAPKPVRPLCGCAHHHSFHDPQTGQCHGTIQVERPRVSYNVPLQFDDAPCTCRQYSGPLPMPEYYAPELSDGGHA